MTTNKKKEKWEEEFDILLVDVFMKQRPFVKNFPLRQLQVRGRYFISNLLSEERDKSFKQGFKQGKAWQVFDELERKVKES